MSKSFETLSHPQRKPLRISTDIPLLITHSSLSSSGSSPPANQGMTAPSVATLNTGSHQCLFRVLCMHTFESSDPDHLPFHKDEVLTIVKQEHSGWWAAMRPEGDRMGWIPSSFVSPLDRVKIADYPEETLRPYDDPPLSTVHDLWVPVSDEDSKVLAFQLVTPTDTVILRGICDARVGNHNDEPHLNPSNHEQSNGVGYACVPPIPESPHGPHFPPSSPLSEPGSLQLQLTRPASPLLLDAIWYPHPHPYVVDDQMTSVSSDEIALELIPSLSIEESHLVSE